MFQPYLAVYPILNQFQTDIALIFEYISILDGSLIMDGECLMDYFSHPDLMERNSLICWET